MPSKSSADRLSPRAVASNKACDEGSHGQVYFMNHVPDRITVLTNASLARTFTGSELPASWYVSTRWCTISSACSVYKFTRSIHELRWESRFVTGLPLAPTLSHLRF